MGAAGFGDGAFGCAAASADVRRHDATTTDRAASCIRLLLAQSWTLDSAEEPKVQMSILNSLRTQRCE